MRYPRLGNGPLEVPELSFGAWLTVAGGIGREQAIRCIHAALDCGITLFDAVNQYGAVEAEQVLGDSVYRRLVQLFRLQGMLVQPCLCALLCTLGVAFLHSLGKLRKRVLCVFFQTAI